MNVCFRRNNVHPAQKDVRLREGNVLIGPIKIRTDRTIVRRRRVIVDSRRMNAHPVKQ